MEFQSKIKSDDLAALRAIFSEEGSLAQFGSIFQISLILDANTILADIRWLLIKANDSTARTTLQESIDSSVIVAFAPTYLIEEVELHLPRITSESGKNESVALKHWEEYKKRINFVEVGGPGISDIDPKDVPYVKLQEETGFPIVTKDKDISNMGAKAVHVEVSTITRDYSRSAAVEYQLKLTGIGTVFISETLVRSAVNLIRSLVPNLKKVPAWAWLLLIGGCFWVWSIPNFRVSFYQILENLPNQAKPLGKHLMNEIGGAFQEFSKSSADSRKLRGQLQDKYGV